MIRPSTRPEILAPAGDLTSLRAALAGGADAVYFGLSDGFNARAKADSITREALPEIVAEVHRAGARAYVTVNTLVFESELEPLEQIIRDLATSGVDALIVQDPAVALIAQAICPELELHASTQMTISSPEGIRFAEGLGCTRVVLPRELSTREIRRLRAGSDIELEVFVHGALCMSWSGQCLTSEAWGGRSANRGQCAQSCRLPYDLVVDGETVPLGEVRYLLSPKDLAGFRALPELVEIGVHTLKIEGRYKGPAYVVSAVEAWRRWVDAVTRAEGVSDQDAERLGQDLAEMTMVYSRGFSDGFLGGNDHQHLVEGRFPKHRGLLLGKVTELQGHRVRVAPAPDGRPRTGGLALGAARTGPVGERSAPLSLLGGSAVNNTGAAIARIRPVAGMGVVFDQGRPEDQREQGGPIFGVEREGADWVLAFGRPGPDLRRIHEGDLVWLTGNPAVDRRARKLVESAVTGRVPLRLRVEGQLGEPMRLAGRAGGFEVSFETTKVLSEARGEGLGPDVLVAKLGAVGGSPFTLLDLDTAGLPSGLHLPVSALKALRRQVVGALVPLIEAGQQRVVQEGSVLGALRPQPVGGVQSAMAPGDAQLIPLCRVDAHLDAVLAAGLPTVELDWMERDGLTRAVERAKAAGLSVIIATPRVQKPGEEGFDRRIARLEPDGVLARHWGALMHFLEHPEERRPTLHGDFSLNVTNSLTARHLRGLGLDTWTASHDLDEAQLFELVDRFDTRGLTVALHHHIPTFHTEHCVYAHLLSNGHDIRSCGRPCDDHQISLRDHKGFEHPVIVDPACRNTVYNATAQSAARLVPRLLKAGVRRFRVEFSRESTEEALRILVGYRALLAGELSPSALIARLKVHEQFGVTGGTMQIIR